MSGGLHALLAHASTVPAERRARLVDSLRLELPDGAVLLETCHRVELYSAASIAPPAGGVPAGVEWLRGSAVADHLVAVAVGRKSAVVAEDQILHQLRSAVHAARERGQVPPHLGRMFDVALRAGRLARSWLPARRRSLAELALERVIGRSGPPAGPVLVVGAGEMGRRAVRAIAARGGAVAVSSRTPERAMTLAATVGGRHVEFEPGPELVSRLAGVVIALAGRWTIGPPAAAALLSSGAWVVDLSSPSALDHGLARAFGARLVSIDDLAAGSGLDLSDRLVARLDALIAGSVEEYTRWQARDSNRATARALDEKARAASAAELTALWQRVPALEPGQREEVERMARHLTERLLRDPLEQLHGDEDGRRMQAVRELFRL